MLFPKFVVGALMFVDLTTDKFFNLSQTANCPFSIVCCHSDH